MGHPPLLPLPYFGEGITGGIHVVFEGSAGVVDACKFLGHGLEEQHAAVADSTSGTELTYAGSGPGDGLAILRHAEALSLAKNGSIGTDDGGVGSHTGCGRTVYVAGVFEGNFCGWGGRWR